MANEEIIDLLDLVERGKGAASPSSSRKSSDFKRELDDLFSDEPESGEHNETYERAARPSTSGKKGQVVDFNEKLDMPDMTDLDGLLEDFGGKDEEPEPLEEPDPVMHFPESMKANAKKASTSESQSPVFNLDDLHDDIDQLITEEDNHSKGNHPKPATGGEESADLDNLDSLLDDILNSSEPRQQEKEKPSLEADALFDEFTTDEEIPDVAPKNERNRPMENSSKAGNESQNRKAMERSVLFAENVGDDEELPSATELSDVSGLSEDDVRALVREELAPLNKAVSPESMAEIVQKELAAQPKQLTEDSVRGLVNEALAAIPTSVSLEEVKAVISEELTPLKEATSPARLEEAVRAQVTRWPRPFTADDIRGIVCKELTATPKPTSPDEIKAMIHKEFAAMPASLTSDDAQDMIRAELASLPKSLSSEDVRTIMREELEARPKALDADDIRAIVNDVLADMPKPISIDDIRELVQAEIFTAMPDSPPVTASQVRGVVREELDLRFTAMEERLTTKLLEETQKAIELAAAKAAAKVIREELASLAEEL